MCVYVYNMSQFYLLLGILFASQECIKTVTAQSTLSYDAVLTIVIIELVLSFSIGVICILFSYNLFRAIKDSENESDSNDNTTAEENGVPGGIIRRRSPYGSVDDLDNISRGDGIGGTRSDVRGLVSNRESVSGDDDDNEDDGEHSRSFDYHAYEDDDSEIDYERKVDTEDRGNGGMTAVVRSFTPYLRLW